MTIDDLLERWAVWRSVRMDNGLGYAESALNRLMSGAVNTGGARPSSLPYGVDADSVFTLVDSAVMRLPRFHREVIKVHYSDGFNSRRTKAAECGCSGASFYRYLSDAEAMLAVSLRDSEASRLLNDF